MENFFSYLLETAICLGLFYSVYWLFLKNETFFALNRFYLVSALTISFILPLIKITSPIIKTEALRVTYGAGPAMPAPQGGLTLNEILLGIYLLGVGVFTLRFLYQIIRLASTIKTHGFRIHNGCRYVFIKSDTPPFSFFRFVFLNKDKISPHHLKRIMDHELVHIKQYHSIDILLMEIVSILQWFNPFVWPYKKSLKETHEYLADDGVIAQGCSATRYQLLILEQHVGGKLFEFANNFHHSQIKRRITMMKKNKSKGWAKLKLLFILPLAALLVLVFAEPQVVADTSSDSIQSQQKQAEELTKKEQRQKQEELTKLKKEQKSIETQLKKLKAEYEKTDDPEKQKEIKAKYKQLAEKSKKIEAILAQENGEVTPDALNAKIKQVEEKLKATEDPKKKKELKKILVDLIEERDAMVKKQKAQKEKKKEKK